jgi:hypothetical protein
MTLPQLHLSSSTGASSGTIVDRQGHSPSGSLEEAWPQAVLRSLRAGSVGVAVFVAGYGPYLPHVGTSPAVVDSRAALAPTTSPRTAAEPTTTLEVLTLPVAGQAREVLAALSLNKSQLAEVLRVSRPTVYDWLDGKEPNASNSDRLTMLLRLLARAEVTSASPLNSRFVRQPLSEDGPALLDRLRADTLDSERILSQLRASRALGDKAESRRVTREQRLRALGFEEPSEQQRKDQLAQNVAMRDWPKT